LIVLIRADSNALFPIVVVQTYQWPKIRVHEEVDPRSPSLVLKENPVTILHRHRTHASSEKQADTQAHSDPSQATVLPLQSRDAFLNCHGSAPLETAVGDNLQTIIPRSGPRRKWLLIRQARQETPACGLGL
jgi:hypothetical protein